MSRLKDLYKDEIVDAMIKKFGYKNIKEAPLDISNVMYLHKGKATRVGFKMDGDKKVRFAKTTGEVID